VRNEEFKGIEKKDNLFFDMIHAEYKNSSKRHRNWVWRKNKTVSGMLKNSRPISFKTQEEFCKRPSSSSKNDSEKFEYYFEVDDFIDK